MDKDKGELKVDPESILKEKTTTADGTSHGVLAQHRFYTEGAEDGFPSCFTRGTLLPLTVSLVALSVINM